MQTTTKYASLTEACAALRAQGYEHNTATWSWHHADGRVAETYRGEVTRAYYIRQVR